MLLLWKKTEEVTIHLQKKDLTLDKIFTCAQQEVIVQLKFPEKPQESYIYMYDIGYMWKGHR